MAGARNGFVDDWQSGKTVTECNLHMLTTEDCSDVIFFVGPDKQMVRAHRYVLVSRSCVFHAMFCGGLAEKGEITIPDIEPHVFREFLRYLYTDNVIISEENVTGLTYISRKYAVDDLSNQCSLYLKTSLSEENVCQILEQCHVYGELELEERALKILTASGELVTKSPGFLHLCDSCLNTFVKSEKLNMGEERVFEATLSWARERCKEENENSTPANLRKYLGDSLYEIRFAVLSQDYLVTVVGRSGILTDTERIKIMDRGIDTDTDISPFKPAVRGSIKVEKKCYRTVQRYDSVFSGKSCLGNTDAVSVTVNQNVQLVGCQLYGPHSQTESTYRVSIALYDELYQVTTQLLPVTDRTLRGKEELNDLVFPEPVQLVADQAYSICVKMIGPSSNYGEGGQTSVMMDGVGFSFKNSSKSAYCHTTADQGQIPGLLWKSQQEI